MPQTDSTGPAGTTWAGSHTYRAAELVRPRSVGELQEVVARAPRIRALGSRHSFTDLADTTGTLVSLEDLPRRVEVDPDRRTVTVDGGIRYGDLVVPLHEAGWALATLASLPHISVAGAVATGTHGSGDRVGSLATAVAALEVVGPDGELRTVRRGDPDHAGTVVSLGALGVVTGLTLDVEPTYQVRQDVFTDLSWDVLDTAYDEVTAAGDSVSVFTRWTTGVDQVWVKSRRVDVPPHLPGGTVATETLHMLEDAAADAVTAQGGAPGPWHERLPHFRMEFTPSRGAELQSEYLLPRERAREAFARLRELGPLMAPVLHVGEVRTVAADDLWLSGSEGRDTVAFHFTWLLDPEGVQAVLPRLEDALLPLDGRPHWGKCFAAGADDLAPLYPRWADFRELRRRVDPDGVFGNAFLDRVLG